MTFAHGHLVVLEVWGEDGYQNIGLFESREDAEEYFHKVWWPEEAIVIEDLEEGDKVWWQIDEETGKAHYRTYETVPYFKNDDPFTAAQRGYGYAMTAAQEFSAEAFTNVHHFLAHAAALLLALAQQKNIHRDYFIEKAKKALEDISRATNELNIFPKEGVRFAIADRVKIVGVSTFRGREGRIMFIDASKRSSEDILYEVLLKGEANVLAFTAKELEKLP